MVIICKVLIGLAGLAFVLAVVVAQTGLTLGVPPEAFSRASNNLALIAIALIVADKRDANPK